MHAVMEVASVPLGVVSMQAPLISHCTSSVKLPFILKAVAIIVIVEFCATENEGRGRMYNMYETN